MAKRFASFGNSRSLWRAGGFSILALLLGSACAWGGPAQAQDSLPDYFQLYNFGQVYQTWNNCAGATLTMALNYWGWGGDQQSAARFLKPNEEDKNVSPGQITVFVNDHVPGLLAIARQAGDITRLKQLIVAGFPVIIETGFDPADLDWMGHYRLLVGYDNSYNGGSFYIFDSYLGSGDGQGILETYADIDTVWQHFNRVYLVIYTPERAALLADLLGDDWDVQRNIQHALQVAQSETLTAPENRYAWFNLGTSYVLGGAYEEAAAAYDRARRLRLPWRMLWYQFGPFEAYLHTGRLHDVEALARHTLKRTPYVEELYYYLGMAQAARGDYNAAIAEFDKALAFNPNFTPAYAPRQEARLKVAYIQ